MAKFFLRVICMVSFFGFFGVEGGDEIGFEVVPAIQSYVAKGYVSYDKDHPEITIHKVGIKMKLNCWAPFPINLRFDGLLTNQESRVKLFREEVDENTSIFFINVTFTAYEETTGTYSCFSVKEPSLKKKFHVFVSPSATPKLVLRAKNISLVLERDARSNQSSVILPCATTQRVIYVVPFKDGKKLNHALNFDPTIGFNISFWDTEEVSNLVGTYECRMYTPGENSLFLEIKPPKEFSVKPNRHDVTVALDEEKKNLECFANEPVAIEKASINDIKDDTEEVDEIDPRSNFQLGPFKYNATYTASNIYAESKDIAAHITVDSRKCVGKTSGRMFYHWLIIYTKTEFGVEQGKLNLEEIRNACNGKSLKIVYFRCSNYIECEISKCSYWKDDACVRTQCNDWSCMTNGIIQCVSLDDKYYDYSQIFFSGLSSNIKYSHWSRVPENDQVLLYKAKGTPSHYVCDATAFLFASGFLWILEYKGGTRANISQDVVKTSWGDSRAVLRSTVDLTTYMTNEMDQLDNIICSLPYWNETKRFEIRAPILQVSDLEVLNITDPTNTGDVTNASSSQLISYMGKNLLLSFYLLTLLLACNSHVN